MGALDELLLARLPKLALARWSANARALGFRSAGEASGFPVLRRAVDGVELQVRVLRTTAPDVDRPGELFKATKTRGVLWSVFESSLPGADPGFTMRVMPQSHWALFEGDLPAPPITLDAPDFQRGFRASASDADLAQSALDEPARDLIAGLPTFREVSVSAGTLRVVRRGIDLKRPEARETLEATAKLAKHWS